MIRLAMLIAYVLLPLQSMGQASTSPATVRYNDRLEALTPDEPLAYFLLAEEVADSAQGPGDLLLARRLYVLSIVLSENSKNDDLTDGLEFPIAASASLGLAALEPIDSRRRWLRALAGRIDERYAQRRWDMPDEDPSGDAAALLLAEAIGLALSGDGTLARNRFDDPRVIALLDRTRDTLNRSRSNASATAIQRAAEIWPCPECGNARIVPDRYEGGNARRLCSTCRGDPGPLIDKATYIDYLAFQSILLRGVQTTWSTEIAVRGAAPLRDPDVSEIAPTVGFDPSLVYFRDGRWVADPDGEAKAGDG